MAAPSTERTWRAYSRAARWRRSTVNASEEFPFGASELLAAVGGAARVLDAGCGSGRLTVALAQAGAHVTGIDTSAEQLDYARQRAREQVVELTLVEADFNDALPFDDGVFEGVVSRLSLMAARDAVSTLRELRRVLVAEGRLGSVLWARPERNPWFAQPRAAAGVVLGGEQAAFARAFGKLGELEEAAGAHRAAGLRDVDAHVVEGEIDVADAQEHWALMTRRIGHFSRLDARLTPQTRGRIVDELAGRLESFRDGDRLLLPRALILVTARR